MIERPKRAVTRFFIPLIDVLILLFCIFLLMPFMNSPGGPAPSDKPDEKMTPDEMKKEVASLRIDLERARKDLRQVLDIRGNPAERVSVSIMEIDPASGILFHYLDGKREDIDDQRSAQKVIDDHKRLSAVGQDLLFLVLMPNRAREGAIKYDRLRDYKRWFMAVPFKFENTHNYEVP